MPVSRRSLLAGGLALQVAGTASAVVRLPKAIRVGLLGFDGHAAEILDPLPQLPDVQLVAVCEQNPATVARASKNPLVAAAKKYSRLSDMLEQERLDVVAVCNTNGERAGAIVECAQRRINVIAEKPLAVTADEYLQVRQAVIGNGIALGMLVPMRFEPQFAALRRIINSGLIGEVIQVSAQ